MRRAGWRAAALGVLALGLWACEEAESTPGGPDLEVIGAGGGGAGGVGGGAGGAGGGAGGAGGARPDNGRPELRRVGDRRAPAESELVIQLQASDPDEDPLTFNVRSVLPDGAKFEKDVGRFTWTPTPAQVGVIALITFEVSDGQLKDQETIQITVIPAGSENSAPIFEPISDTSLVAGQAWSLQLVATDPDGDPVVYGMRGDDLPGAVLDGDAGRLSWTPGLDLIGRAFNVTFTATDGAAEASVSVVLSVRDGSAPGPGNLPPRILPIEDQLLTVGVPFEIRVQAEDEMPAALSFGVAGALPEGASFDGPSATFRWTPVPAQANQAFAVVFQVSDGEFRAVERVNFQVQPAGAGDACVPDPPEDEAAEPLRLMDGARLEGRSICPLGDRDSFDFVVPEGGGFDFRIAFDGALCDLDLVVVDAAGDEVGVSAGFGDSERVVRDGLPGGIYLARIIGAGCTSPAYSVALDIFADAACQDDAFDAGAGNDTPETAADLLAAVGQPLQICSGDLDYYAIELAVGERVVIRARFRHADGDLDLSLQGPVQADGTRFTATALSVTDDEEIVVESAPHAGRYVLEVRGYLGATNSYRLELERQAAQPCAPDRLEPNDMVGQARPLPPELYRNLTWCGDEDWYRTNAAAGHLLQVYITYDTAAPTLVATNDRGVALEGFTYRAAEGSGCGAGRDGCRRLEGVSPGGTVYFVVRAGRVGQGYDLRVRLTAPDTCTADVVRCDALEVCDYDRPACADALCNVDRDCPGGFECRESWCVEACARDADCLHPSQACKVLDGEGRCALTGPGRVGAACVDFTDCTGAFDCLTGPSVPGGYCTRDCDSDLECAEGRCAQFDDGRYCATPCARDQDCRVGYACTARVGVFGQEERVCTPP